MANKLTSDAFFNRFKASSLLLLSCPIKVALFDRKLSLNKFVLIMKQKGFIYDYYLLKVVLNGKANNHFNLHYFTHLYNVLNLPMPTPDYLYKSALRWEEIKQFKKERRNTNRIKRGLEPIL
jgi:hypothetical protein